MSEFEMLLALELAKEKGVAYYIEYWEKQLEAFYEAKNN